MADNRINFQIDYTVDKAGLSEISNALKNVQQEASKASATGSLTKELETASKAAKELEGILNSSWNSKLNQLDLSKLNNGIKSSFGSVQNLKASFEGSGNAGVAAFNKVSSSILNTNMQMKQTSKLLDSMAVSMANTVKWGITSSIFNNITGSIQKAWGYTQKLDASLNDIQIVTGKSSDEMQRFAKEANSAAKALGANTVDFIDASLIYYQQGLSDEDVLDRTNTTMKMANVLGMSAEEVSSHMTAIWNNFDSGSHSLEYFGDVITALGATTAASASEIAEGLEKFASIGETVGLSYEYATSALAAVVANTRQSADSVGTAFKTIFSRLQGLKLGETLEDGVDLNKYSQVLDTIGVKVLDASGEMRKLDNILDDLAVKWDSLTSAQQTAVAQTVAGTRQYTQMIALMESWDDVTKNLETAANATGTLEEQQEIYMQSMEAHLKQLRTESERTYDILFNTGTINDFIDSLTGALTLFNNFIEGIGGGGNVITYFASMFVSLFNQQIANAILTQKANLESFIANVNATKLKEMVVANNAAGGSNVSNGKALQEEIAIQKQILAVRKGLTQEAHNELIAIQQKVGLNTQEIENLKSYEKVSLEILDNVDATNADYRERISLEGKVLADQKQELSNFTLATNKLKEQYDIEQNIGAVELELLNVNEAIEQIRNRYNEGSAQSLRLAELANNVSEGNLLTEAEIAEIREMANSEIVAQEQLYNRIVQAAERKARVDAGDVQTLEQQNIVLKRQATEYIKTAKSTRNIQTGIITAMAAAQAMTSVVGGLKTAFDNTSSAVEKTEGAVSAISGTLNAVAMGVGTYFGGPLVGMLASSVVGGLSNLIGSVFIEAKKESEEAIKEIRQQWDELAASSKKTVDDIATLEGLESEFRYLSTGVSEYGENISLTADEYARYQSIVEEIVGISPDVVEGYTNEGEAIVNNNGLIQQTIDLLKQQQIEQKKNLLTKDAINTLGEGAEDDYNRDKKTAKNADNTANVMLTHVEAGNTANMGVDYLNNFGFFEAVTQQSADTKDALTADINEIKALYSDENEYGLFVTNYEKLVENREEIVQKIKELQEKWNLTDEQLWGVQSSSGKVISASGFLNADDFLTYLQGAQNKLDETKENIKKAQEDVDADMKAFNDKVVTWLEVYSSDYQDMSNEEQLAVQAYVSNFTTTDFSYEGFEKLTEQADAFVKRLAGFDKDTQEKIQKLLNPNNFDTYQEYVNELSAFFKEQSKKADGLTADEIMDLFGLDNISNSEVRTTITDQVLELQEQVRAQLGDDSFNLGDYFTFDELANGTLENIGGINFSALNSVKEFDHVFQRIQQSNYTKKLEESFAEIEMRIKTLDEAFAEFDKNGEFSAETISKLEAKYSELGEIQDKKSHEYLEALRLIRETEEDNAKAALETQKEALEKQAKYWENYLFDDDGNIVEYAVEADITAYQKTIDKLLETDYQIDMQINADLASDVDQAFGLADEIDNLSGYITDSFQMTYDEAQAAIEAGYGAMLQNAQESADGIIQLDEGVVNAFIDGKQAELEADKQSKIAQLENQKAMLQTQLQTLQAKQQALSNAREANTKGDKQAALAEAMMLEAQYQAQLEAMNAELAADAEQKSKLAGKSEELYNVLSGMYETDSQNEQNATDASDKTAALHGKNVVAYYNNMQQAVVAYSEAVAAAESGEASYKEVPWNNGAGGTDAASAGQTAVKNAYNKSYQPIESTIEDLTSNMSLDEIDAAIDQMNQDTQAQIDTINNQIGAIDAGIAALNSASDKLDYKQSHGGKTPKEASKGSEDSKEKDPDQMDPFTDKDVDVFREVDQEINKISKDLSNLQREEKRLTGKELLDNLNKQLKVLNSQRDAYAAKIKLAQQEADMLRNSLSNQGVAFNNDGTVANYQQALEAKQKYINDLIEQYNGMSADEQKEFKETVENAKKDYESFKKSMDEYDKYLLDVIPGLKEQIEEALEKEIEIQITKFNMAVEIRLDLTKAEKDWNEFNRRVIKGLNKDTDKGYLTGTLEETLANMGSYYNAQRTGQIQIGTDQVNKILDEIAIMNAGGHSDVYSAYDAETDTWVDNKAKALEDLKKNYEQLMQDLEQMEDYADAVDEAFLKSIDNVAAAFEQKSKILDFYSKQIDHDLKMTKLLYGDKAYDKIGKRQERQLEHLEKQKNLIQEQTNYWKRLMDAAREAGDNEAYKKYRDNWMDSIDELNSKIEEWAELTKEKYANTVQEIIDNLNKEVTGGLGLDQVGEEWELINKNADNYLDIINRAFALQSLENKWQDAINKTDSVSAQKKLNELMSEQMDMLREKDTLTQYDIDRANMEYEIALKQIALEEAQQNKSTMKLKRDANGNYSYQFVSDEDSILQAQQDLAEAQNKLYNFDKDAYQQNLDEIYSIWSEFQQKVADAYTKFADDQEALSEYIALLQEQYGEKINFLTEQNLSIRENLQESAFTELANMYETDVTNFQGMSDDEKDIIMNSLLPQWDSGVQYMTDKFIGDGGFVPACEDAFSQLGEAANDYREKTEEIGQMADEVSQRVESEHRILEHEAQNAIDAAEEEKQRIGEIREEVQRLIEDYKEARNAAIQAANAAYAYWTQEQKNSIAAVVNDLNNPGGGDSGSGNGSGGGSGSGSSGSGGSGGGDGKLSVGDTATFTGQYYYDSYGLTPIGSKYSGVANGVVIDNVNNNPYGIHIHSADGKYGDLGWVKKSQLSGYDTGGYTGEWDSSGRLALLHQKELVLNAHDTENMLNIVGMVRDLTDSLNNSMLSRAFGLMESIATNLTSVREVGSDTLEQDVHIEATFPNVHESREIENALNNLVNRASQFANRKQR